MAKPVLYGPTYSTYVRSAQLTLAEKGVEHDFVAVDFLQGMPAEQVARHPFGKVPAFEHDGLDLYETCAIERYIDEAFAGPALQPADPASRAKMTQIISVLDSYAYGSMVQKVMIPRVVAPMMGGTTDEAVIRDALPVAERSLNALDGFIGDRNHLVGNTLTLADLHAVPIIAYFRMAPDSAPLLARTANVQRWYEAMRARPSVQKFASEEVK